MPKTKELISGTGWILTQIYQTKEALCSTYYGLASLCPYFCLLLGNSTLEDQTCV